MARDEATLQNARIDLKRYQDLISQGAVTQQQLDTQAATVRQSEGTVKSDQGAIDNAKLNLVYCQITSPLTGRIGLRAVDRGNIVHAADPNGLATITQLQPIAVIFNMPEDNLPEVQDAMRKNHALVGEAWDRNLQHQIATGRLLTLDNTIDQSTGTVRVKLEFANKDNRLFPNQFVNAKLLVDVVKNALVVPGAAIQRGPQSTFVWVVKQDNTVEMRNIKTGPSEGDRNSITSGLNDGDRVVIQGADKLMQGSKVTVRSQRAGQQGSAS
jgi:multidrug efflux system membrane fusion protein